MGNKEKKELDLKLKSDLIVAHLVSRHIVTHSTYNFHLACMSSAFCVHIVTLITQIGGSIGCYTVMDWTLIVNLREILISPVGSFWFNWGQSHIGSMVSVIYRSEILNHRQPSRKQAGDSQ